MPAEILAYTEGTNADLIEACGQLGYIRGDTLDATYGQGRFWNNWRPYDLWTNDSDDTTAAEFNYDFTDFPLGWVSKFDTVVFDPPYKLNGTGGSHPSDAGYGVADTVGWRERHELIRRGILECSQVLKTGGHLLLKCQDQVSSGKVRWQTLEFSDFATNNWLELVDRFDLIGHRRQPEGRRQLHARRNASTLLVFKKVGK